VTGDGRTPWAIPETWEWTVFGEVAQVVGGGTPRTSDPSNWEQGIVPWVTPADLSGYTGKYISHGERFLTERGLQNSSARLMPAGALLMSSRAPIGYVAIAARPLSTNQGFKSYVLKEPLLPEYFYYYLLGNRELVQRLASGTTFLEISGKSAARVPVPIAPIAEQQRIVAAIESHFTCLDAAVVALKRAQANLRRYRAAILKAACEGRLVPTEAELAQQEGSRYEAADSLVARILDQRPATIPTEEPSLLPEIGLPPVPVSWRWVSLSALLRERLRNGHSARKVTHGNGGVRTFTLSAVTQHDFSIANTKLTVANPERVGDLWAAPGDIYIERSNTPELVGTAALYTGAEGFAIFPDLLIRVRVTPLVLPSYVELVLRSEPLRRYFQTAAQGIAGSMPKIDQTVVARAPIPLPPIAEQRRLVAEHDRRMDLADRALAATDSALLRAVALRRRILENAFRGRLVSQDQRDEAARLLLERIRSARERELMTKGRKAKATAGER
jgi:type I restriction enzyme, S subunit